MPTALEEGTAFGQDDAEFAILNTDRQLSALQTAVEMLRPLPDQKALIYFASGLKLSGVDNQAQLRSTTNAALRANVSIFPVDARGLGEARGHRGRTARAAAGHAEGNKNPLGRTQAARRVFGQCARVARRNRQGAAR